MIDGNFCKKTINYGLCVVTVMDKLEKEKRESKIFNEKNYIQKTNQVKKLRLFIKWLLFCNRVFK